MSAFKSASYGKGIFLKTRIFHNWLTIYPDSEFHGHCKTVTLSFISPNLSKHWIFLAFWLSLCFGSFLLFLVDLSWYSILVQHACNDRAWLTSECSPRYDNSVWENRRDSRHVTSPASWVYITRELKTLKRKSPGCWMLFGRERKFTEKRFSRKNAGNSRISTQTRKGRGTLTTWHLLWSPKNLCYTVDWSICYPSYMLDLRSK